MYWIWIVLLNFAVVVFILMMLRCFLPRRIRQAVEANGLRLDGSISKKRSAIESRELRSVIGTAVAFALPILFLLNVLLIFTHYRVAPLSLATEAFQNFSWDDNEWQERLSGTETQNLSSRFQGWKDENGISGSQTLFQLMASWPLAVTVFCMLTMAMFAVCGGSYIAGLKRLEPRVKKRHQEYLAYDMRRRHEQVESTNRKDVGPVFRESSLANSHR